jgi:hypothetical protein
VLGKHSLGPKEKTSLRIVFDTTGSPGLFRKIATLTTNSPGEEELEVTVEGSVIEAPCAKIQTAPRRVDLGSVSPGPLNMKPLAVSNPGSLPLVITKIYTKGTNDSHVSGSLTLTPGETKTVEVAIHASPEPGDHEETIVIESNAKNAPKGGYLVLVRYRTTP